MKTLQIIALALLSYTSLNAQIKFTENVPFQTVLDQAKKENKLVFMDCYTTWCGPCKWLVSNIFADQKIADTYNNQFINFKSDMEKGEGIELAKRFNIRMYPTLLWLSGDGEVAFIVVGTNTVEAFLEFANNLKEDENLFPNMVEKFDSGNRDPEFLKKIATAAAVGYDSKADVYAETYLNAIPKEDWVKEENMGLLYAACKTFESTTTKYLLSNSKSFNSELIDGIVSQCIDTELKDVLDSKSEEKLKVLLSKIDTHAAGRSDLKQGIELHFYRSTGNIKKMNELATVYLGASQDPDLLNEYAWYRFETENDTKLLKEAIVWAQRSVKLDKNYANTDTLGQLYQKVGNTKKAKKWLAESKRLEPK